MKSGVLILWALLFTVFSISPAYANVTSDEAKRVIDYYYNGKGGGAVMLEAVLCREVVAEGPEKNNCGQAVDESDFPINEEITAWAAFLVPMEDTDTIYVEFKNAGMVWKTRELNVKGAIRWRSWTSHKLDRAGKWTISFKKLDEAKGQSVLLKEFDVTVK